MIFVVVSYFLDNFWPTCLQLLLFDEVKTRGVVRPLGAEVYEPGTSLALSFPFKKRSQVMHIATQQSSAGKRPFWGEESRILHCLPSYVLHQISIPPEGFRVLTCTCTRPFHVVWYYTCNVCLLVSGQKGVSIFWCPLSVLTVQGTTPCSSEDIGRSQGVFCGARGDSLSFSIALPICQQDAAEGFLYSFRTKYSLQGRFQCKERKFHLTDVSLYIAGIDYKKSS